MDAKTEKIALFRYGLIAPLVIEVLPHGEMTRRAREIAAREHELPFSNRNQVSVDTLLIWARRYRLEGFSALAPRPRCDSGVSRVITPQMAQLIERLKRENPHRAGTTLLRELALSSGSDRPPISSASLYRFLKEKGLTERELLNPAVGRKKFEAEYANQIWQSDMMYTSSARKAESANVSSLPSSTMPAASFPTPSSTRGRAWIVSWIACAKG
jgi:transposase